MAEDTQNAHNHVIFTESQFGEVQKFLQNYLKIMALGSIRENETERNVRLLNSANYSQEEIATILHLSQSTVSRVLAGKATKKKEEE